MSATLPRIEAGDAELISAVRAGDVDAYGELFDRHVEAARRLGRQLVPGPDVDDLVSEAFVKVLSVLQRGGGPDLAFRAYLLTAVRRLHVDKIRAGSRLHTTGDLTPFDPGVPFRDTAVEGFENAAAARAFASLPERWQMVLWHTEVEGQKPAEVAALLGISANSVSALAYRAREGLRQAFLSMHVQSVEDADCTWTHQHLGSYVRNGLARRDAQRIESHLDECRACLAIYLELTEVNSNIGALLAPLLLGGAATAYVASGGTVAASGGALVLLADRVRDLVAAHAPVTAVAGVAVAGVIVSALFGTFPGGTATSPEASVGPRAGAPTGSVDEPVGQPGHRAVGPANRQPVTDGAPTPSLPAQDAPAPPPSPTTDEEPPGPGPGTTPEPEPTPPGPARTDLSVAARATRSAPATYGVRVRVAGLAPGNRATLVVTSDSTAVALTLDGRCRSEGPDRGSCEVRVTPTTFDFLAVTPGTTTLTFTVRPDGPEVETNPADNTTSVVLTP